MFGNPGAVAAMTTPNCASEKSRIRARRNTACAGIEVFVLTRSAPASLQSLSGDERSLKVGVARRLTAEADAAGH